MARTGGRWLLGMPIVAWAMMMAAVQPAAAQVPVDEATWAAIATPGAGAPQVIGSYANGCVAGARPIPLDGFGFQVIRPQRNRFWGHPDLIAFVNYIGRRAIAEDIGVLMIADAGQPRGGPITGHASHEVGLDVDIWLSLRDDYGMSDAERANPTAVSVLTADGTDIDQSIWSDRHVRLYRAAASYPGVTRIFAHPLIKRELCRSATGDRSWLRRIRPWYGHHAHLHIRLNCPAGSTLCEPQPDLPAGDGCGSDLTWWLSDAPYQPGPTGPAPPPPPMPVACGPVLTGSEPPVAGTPPSGG